MTPSIRHSLAALTVTLTLALAAARPASACAMYIPPAEKVVVQNAPAVPVQPDNQVAAVAAPTDLQRAMALIDQVGLIPEASASVVAAKADIPAAAPLAAVSPVAPPMASAPRARVENPKTIAEAE